jgi:hypothetical protein
MALHRAGQTDAEWLGALRQFTRKSFPVFSGDFDDLSARHHDD